MSRAKRGKSRKIKARQSKSRQGKARQGKTRQDKARQGKTRQDKTRQDKTRQDKTRQGKARQGKARQGKARQGKASTAVSACNFICNARSRRASICKGMFNRCVAWTELYARVHAFPFALPSFFSLYVSSSCHVESYRTIALIAETLSIITRKEKKKIER